MSQLEIIVLVAVGSAVLAFLTSKSRSGTPVTNGNFTPDTGNDKFVLVSGWTGDEILTIISDFDKTYQKSEYPSYSIDLRGETMGVYRLSFPQDIHPLLLAFLVNYIAYPFKPDFKNRPICVGAASTVSKGFEGVDPVHWGKKAILYIPEHDKGYNEVYMQTNDGVAFANTFKKCVWRQVGAPRLSSQTKALMEAA